MGEEIFGFVLSDINGIPSLPVFIGNYLLDLLSTFFPIFMLLSSFVMVYIGFTRGSGDWKQTAQQIAPTAVSMAVIMGLLSMKTPYSDTAAGGMTGEFWKDVNSYTVVEMMNTFLGFGNIFADALTHKIVYGSINVDKIGPDSYNGYFPAVLQTLIDKDISSDTKKFLMDKGLKEEIINKVSENNNQISANTKTIITNLGNLGVIHDYKRPRGDNQQNIGDMNVVYNDVNKRSYFVPITLKNRNKLSGIAADNNGGFIYTKPKFPDEPNSDSFIYETEKEALVIDKLNERLLSPNSGIKNFEIIDFVKMTEDNSGVSGRTKNREVDVLETLAKYREKVGKNPSGSSIRAITKPSVEETFAYMEPNNFEQEKNIINSVKAMVTNYKDVLNIYTDEITAIENKMKSAKDSSEKKSLQASLNRFVEEKQQIINQTLSIALLHKEVSDLVSELTGENLKDQSFADEVNTLVGGEGIYESLQGQYFNKAEVDSIRQEMDSISNANVKSMNFWSNSNDVENRNTLIPILDKTMKSKVYITTIIYDKYKDLLKDDTYFQAKLGFRADAPYTRLFTSTNHQNALNKIDDEIEKVKQEATMGGTKTVGQVLHDKIMDEKTSGIGSDFKNGTVIHWTDLGKHYATFKNIYSPMITNIYSMQAKNSLEVEKSAVMINFMTNLEPDAKSGRLMDAAGVYGAASLGSKVFQQWAKAGDMLSKKDSLGSIFDIIKIIGGMYFAILFVNVILPAFIWMFVIITYYVEMSIYVAVFPIGFMFMIFQSYRQSLHQYINMLLGFILMPIVLVSMYFIVLYIDMLLPLFFKQFLPFFASSQELENTFSLAFGNANSITHSIFGTVGKVVSEAVNMTDKALDTDLVSKVGNFVYTLLSMLMSVLLLLTFFRANEYMSKILNVSTVGMDSFQGKETINKFGSFDKSGLTSAVSGR